MNILINSDIRIYIAILDTWIRNIKIKFNLQFIY